MTSRWLTKPNYIYVASSWRNPLQPSVCTALTMAGIEHYDFKNPPNGTGFSWREVKIDGPLSTSTSVITVAPQRGATATCACGGEIVFDSFLGMGCYEPDINPHDDPVTWRHRTGGAGTGYAGCDWGGSSMATPVTVKPKGSDWQQVDEYLRMVDHPRAVEGFDSDFDAMRRADTFVLVLPCGKSAHLELGWAVGAGKRTAILLEDPVEPELMYRMVDYLAPSLSDLLGWLGVS